MIQPRLTIANGMGLIAACGLACTIPSPIGWVGLVLIPTWICWTFRLTILGVLFVMVATGCLVALTLPMMIVAHHPRCGCSRTIPVASAPTAVPPRPPFSIDSLR